MGSSLLVTLTDRGKLCLLIRLRLSVRHREKVLCLDLLPLNGVGFDCDAPVDRRDLLYVRGALQLGLHFIQVR